MTALEQTSIPAWAASSAAEEADPTGREHAIIAIGESARDQAEAWRSFLVERSPASRVTVHEAADADQARASLDGELVRARVGWRLAVAGPADACLAVRARAVAAGLEDDEMRFASTDTNHRSVFCVHCRATMTVDAEIEQVVPCAACGRSLLVYYHVSRLSGSHLGFMVDAERLPDDPAAGGE